MRETHLTRCTCEAPNHRYSGLNGWLSGSNASFSMQKTQVVCTCVCRQPDGGGLGRHGWSPEGGVLHPEQPLPARGHHPHHFRGGHCQLRFSCLLTELPKTFHSQLYVCTLQLFIRQLHACAVAQQAHSAASGVQRFHTTDAQA